MHLCLIKSKYQIYLPTSDSLYVYMEDLETRQSTLSPLKEWNKTPGKGIVLNFAQWPVWQHTELISDLGEER